MQIWQAAAGTFKIKDPEEKLAARKALIAPEGDMTKKMQVVEDMVSSKTTAFYSGEEPTLADFHLFTWLGLIRSGCAPVCCSSSLCIPLQNPRTRDHKPSTSTPYVEMVEGYEAQQFGISMRTGALHTCQGYTESVYVQVPGWCDSRVHGWFQEDCCSAHQGGQLTQGEGDVRGYCRLRAIDPMEREIDHGRWGLQAACGFIAAAVS